MKNVIIVKLGSSVLSKIEAIPAAIHAVYQHVRNGYKVLVVVSAIGNTTDELIDETKKLVGEEAQVALTEEYAALLATGEMKAASLLTIGLDRAGIKTKKLDYHCLVTQGPRLNAEPVRLNVEFIQPLWATHSVLVMPGFIGCNAAGEVTLLGRGGSDYTAVFVAWALNAQDCIIYKDTPGIFDQDPNESTSPIQHFQRISFDDCLKTSYQVIQHKAVKFAEQKNFRFLVKSLTGVQQTWVGGENSQLSPQLPKPKKLRVTLLGLGTVGLGVYKHLSAHKELFEIVGIAVKNIDKHQYHDAPPGLISDDAGEILARVTDVVVELVGGVEKPAEWITDALQRGYHVVTANKALMASHGLQLEKIAKENTVQLYYSAAVGGAVPILENLQKMQSEKPGNIQSITGIINGTCNFILDKVSEGHLFAEALSLAQSHGFAESDPSADIDGIDAAQKAVIISRFAFGKDPDHLNVQGIRDIGEIVNDGAGDKKTPKLIVNCSQKNGQIYADVQPLFLDRDHPLATVKEADNGVLIKTVDNDTLCWLGKGAGRWPTAEAVFADLLSLSFHTNH